ncbi:hypothetical protein [Curtobacterium sp. RRHDQ10]|uniref:hypothetical protein n=1 Tax=Curtobacterium phyllosphaerae TaxID=3413379 RepID=UPI003BEFA455
MTPTPTRVRPRLHPIETVAMVVVSLALTVVSYLHKTTCTTGVVDGKGSSVGVTLQDLTQRACYSDVLSLWGGRRLVGHLLPYVHGSYTADPPAVHGGTVEYPTLTGLVVWLTALPVRTDSGFLFVTMLVFLPIVATTTVLLARTAGHRAWIWAATPPLAIYALYNWDVLPVLATTGGLALVLVGPRRWSPRTRVLLAAAAFGIGGALKLYPVMFVLPLALAVLAATPTLPLGQRLLRALAPVGVAVGVLAVANVPFVLVNAAGWFSVFRFQAARVIDASTLSVWYWGFRPWSDDTSAHTQAVMRNASTVATALAIAAVVVVSLVLARRRGHVPWVQTAAALLCVYMAFNKVDSLQYTLWLLPFFVVLRVRIGWVVAYLVADLAAFVGWYRWIYYGTLGHASGTTWADQALAIGVWGRFGLLLALVFAFFASEVARRTPGTVDAVGGNDPDAIGPSAIGPDASDADGNDPDAIGPDASVSSVARHRDVARSPTA